MYVVAGKRRAQVEAEEAESRSRGHGDGEPEALPGEQVHHRGEREAPGEGQRAPPREPRPAPEPVQDGGRRQAAGGRSGIWNCVRLLPLADERGLATFAFPAFGACPSLCRILDIYLAAMSLLINHQVFGAPLGALCHNVCTLTSAGIN